jgi:hypothetical protein
LFAVVILSPFHEEVVNIEGNERVALVFMLQILFVTVLTLSLSVSNRINYFYQQCRAETPKLLSRVDQSQKHFKASEQNTL